MNTTAHSQDNTRQNLLVINNSGRIVSRRVSHVYGTGLLYAIAHSMKIRTVHHTGLIQSEAWTLQNIKEDAQATNPGHNIIFVDDNRRILSCQINPDHGIALLESLPENPTEVADHAEAALSHDTTIQSGEASSSKQGTRAESSQRPSMQSEPQHTDSSFPLNTSAAAIAISRILSDQVLSTLNRQPYDRNWMSKYNINDSCLNGPSSNIKLDVLLKNGAIKAGDVLCVKYELDDGSLTIEFGQVLHPSRDPQDPYHSRLDLHVLSHQVGIDGIVYDCKDATGVINGLNREDQKTKGKFKNLSEPGKMVGVFEEDTIEVGNLWTVMQAYEVFTKVVTEWGERNKMGVD